MIVKCFIGFFLEIIFSSTCYHDSFLLYFRKLGLDLVPRQGAHMVEPDTMSVVELYHVVITNKIVHPYRIDHTACEYGITSQNGKKKGSNAMRNNDEI